MAGIVGIILFIAGILVSGFYSRVDSLPPGRKTIAMLPVIIGSVILALVAIAVVMGIFSKDKRE